MKDMLYVLVLGLFFSHELDAVKRHEWRLLPVINRMSDVNGFTTFVLAHVPVFGIVLWFSFAPAVPSFRVYLAMFAILHVGLHMAYARHPANEFNNPLSQSLIWGTGIAGAAYLLAVFAVPVQG